MAGFISIVKGLFTFIAYIPTIISVLKQIMSGIESTVDYAKDKARNNKAEEGKKIAKETKDTSKLESVY